MGPGVVGKATAWGIPFNPLWNLDTYSNGCDLLAG
jgi:hypothetical protein